MIAFFFVPLGYRKHGDTNVISPVAARNEIEEVWACFYLSDSVAVSIPRETATHLVMRLYSRRIRTGKGVYVCLISTSDSSFNIIDTVTIVHHIIPLADTCFLYRASRDE